VKVTRYRTIRKDPGLSRTEVIAGPGSFPPPDRAVPAERVVSAVIMRSGRDESTIVRLEPREKMAWRTTLSYGGTASTEREGMPRDLVAGTWDSLRKLAADDTRVVGERMIDGVSTVGFEARADEMPGGAAARADGVVRVWAAAGTAVPVEIEIELQDPSGATHRTVFGNLEWNVPVDDELFETPDLEGWRVIDESVREVGFSSSSLADGVTLRVGFDDGPTILTEADIVAIPSGREIRGEGAEPRRVITVVASAEAGARLREVTAAHVGERVVVDLDDGAARYEIRIGAPLGRTMQIDITPLGKTLEEFAEAYLAP
jgi:hypothetical protein